MFSSVSVSGISNVFLIKRFIVSVCVVIVGSVNSRIG